jgi:LmbE family N-acetylglucosaminyl deacetylase
MNVLFVGAHTDDIEHGAGGLFCRALLGKEHSVQYLSFSRCTDLARNKNIVGDQDRVEQHIQQHGGQVLMLDLPNRRLPDHAELIRERLERTRDTFNPDVVFTHWEHDIHQDHRVVAEESIRVFRNGTIMAYECVRSCPGFAPNAFYALDDDDVTAKINLLSMYKTQKGMYYLARSATRTLASVRGVAIGQKYAEGFIAVRMVFGKQ